MNRNELYIYFIELYIYIIELSLGNRRPNHISDFFLNISESYCRLAKNGENSGQRLECTREETSSNCY